MPNFNQSKFWTAFLIVVGLNLLLATLKPLGKVDAATLPSAHTWEWWRTQSFIRLKKPPDIVLLGSSLMMIPISVLDADYLNRNLDAVHHDQSIYMEDALSRTASFKNLVCFNFALPGSMASDDYMVVRALMHEENHPKLLVIGVTLRDLIESHVPCPASTSTFRYFRHFFATDELVDLAMPEFWQRFDYWQSKLIYMLGNRVDIQFAFTQALTDMREKILPSCQNEFLTDTSKSSTNIAQNLKTEAEEGQFVLHAKQVYPYEDNSQEYRKRFTNPSEKLFNTEQVFLAKLLQLANEDGTKVLLVNMPLTRANMNLMPEGYYLKYLQVLKNTCAVSHSQLLDLNDGKTFVQADFRDTAHMNASGGKKLVDAVVQKIEDDKILVTALKKSVGNLTLNLTNSIAN